VKPTSKVLRGKPQLIPFLAAGPLVRPSWMAQSFALFFLVNNYVVRMGYFSSTRPLVSCATASDW
jgi:hypothetical protein